MLAKLESSLDGVPFKFDLLLGGGTTSGESGVGDTDSRIPIEDILEKLRSWKGEPESGPFVFEMIDGTARFVSQVSSDSA